MEDQKFTGPKVGLPKQLAGAGAGFRYRALYIGPWALACGMFRDPAVAAWRAPPRHDPRRVLYSLLDQGGRCVFWFSGNACVLFVQALH